MNDIDEQLTLYVNGQLDPDSRARLDARLAEDAALRDEVRFLQALRQGLHDQNVPAPGELGLARLKRSLAEEAGAVPAATRAPSRTFWKPLALAACTILGVQTALLMTSTDPTPTDMQPLSGPAAPVQGATVQVVFDAQVSLASIQTLLQDMDADISSGPGALGVYVLRLAPDRDPQAALSQLRASPLVIEAHQP